MWEKWERALDNIRNCEKIAEWKDAIRRLSTHTCGNCEYWMCRQCPYEKNVNGRNKGPSMNAVGCSLFKIKGYHTLECTKLEEKIMVLKALIGLEEL